MMTDSDVANEASRLVSMVKRLSKHVSCEKKLSFLEPVISKFTYFTSKCGLSSNFERVQPHGQIGQNSSLTKRDLEEGMKVCASVEKTIDLPASFAGETPLFHFKLHEFAFACAAFRLELTGLLEEERVAAKVKPEPIRAGRIEPTQPPERPTMDGSGFFAPTFCSSAEPTQQPEPTMVIVFVDQRSRLLEEEWVAAKAARQQAAIDKVKSLCEKHQCEALLSAIAQLGRAK